MKRYLFILVLSLMTVISFPINNSFAATEPLSEEIFQWVQATPRSSYYFNKDAMTYEIGADGYADTNILIVPTVRLFDNMQIQDVIMKRQWRNLSTYRFDELSGVAEYLRINIKDKTVEYTECVYLDQGYNSLYVNYERPTQNMNTMSVKDVDYNFYQAILDYEKEHRKELLTKIIDQVKPEDLKAAGITLTKEQKKNMKENKKQRR
ncbi:hypothetical protein E0L01_10025 [Megamonas funiformis]|uniref:DUF4468 domain-containing protein n=1 Tax=Megamonas hypermegale TaxID=158847 RepID=A0A378NPL7_9FIRM|nr:hypothetical protein [Megamonas hypermegale]NJE29107.1 hypothetical protein [Megamonas funiformis]STY70354.1 Uncharacterised protein [Megamonas hypermegale]